MLAKKFNLKSIVVERGDISLYRKQSLTKFSMRFCYKFSDIVWYRESYKDLDVKKQLEGQDEEDIEMLVDGIKEDNWSNNFQEWIGDNYDWSDLDDLEEFVDFNGFISDYVTDSSSYGIERFKDEFFDEKGRSEILEEYITKKI
jgi:hypothetical protein